MKIALIDPALFTWPYDSELAGGLRALGHEVLLFGKAVGPHEAGAGDPLLRQHFYPELAGAAGRLPAGVLRTLKGLSHVRSMAGLPGALRDWQPDVIHCQWAPLPAVDQWFLPALRRIAPTVLTVHDSNPFNGNPGARIQRLGALKILHKFDRLIVHTAQAADRLRKHGVPPGRVAAIPHGLLHGGPGGATAMPGDDQPVTILQFGKLKPYKGVDVLIRAVAGMPGAARQRCRVKVVGKPYMDVGPLIAMARELGVEDTIQFVFDFIPDDQIMALFQESSAVVFPYREIDTSGVLMAALAVGRPMIASAIGTFAELLEDGRHGHLVPSNDPQALSRALTDIVTDGARRNAMAAEVRALTAAIPSWTEIARRTVDLYRQAMHDRSVGIIAAPHARSNAEVSS